MFSSRTAAPLLWRALAIHLHSINRKPRGYKGRLPSAVSHTCTQLL